ncbi:hypothetical protein GT755_13210 [Herbidospora sp. NEAU-GS84]|uniref:HTH hxlR-type domain-containing protein n=1 Tax=Herbidospora solisilvae TaxID=2696284 RepID=A0A7C9JDW3_9ACTN|nr:hypothetical protein [Herbidospora solisilvae]
MRVPSTYADRNCSLARALEVVGERWTLLIVRDAFFEVRRFGDFATQLKIPRAVLTNRLTPKGVELWPVVRTLMSWGDAHYSPGGARRAVRHDGDGGLLDPAGRCERCGELVPVAETRVEPGPGFDPADEGDDPVSDAINAAAAARTDRLTPGSCRSTSLYSRHVKITVVARHRVRAPARGPAGRRRTGHAEGTAGRREPARPGERRMGLRPVRFRQPPLRLRPVRPGGRMFSQRLLRPAVRRPRDPQGAADLRAQPRHGAGRRRTARRGRDRVAPQPPRT